MFILLQTTLEGDQTVTLLGFRQEPRETHDPRPLVHGGRIHGRKPGRLRLVLLPNLSSSPDPEPPRV